MYSKIFKNFNRVIVTGGSGFIGSNLISKLLKISDCEIYNIDKMGYASDETLIKKSICEENKNRYKLINIDLVDEKDINVAINEIKPDLVMHLAAESHVDRSIDGPKAFIESNIIGTFQPFAKLSFSLQILI